MNIFQAIAYEDFNCCKIPIEVSPEGHLKYDRKKWKIVETKLREAWANANVFEIRAQVCFDKNGLITEFTLQSVKKGKIQSNETEMKCYGEVVYCDVGKQVESNFHEVLEDIRQGFLPRIFENFENLEETSSKVDVAYKSMRVQELEEQLRMAKYELKLAKQKLEGVVKNEKNKS